MILKIPHLKNKLIFKLQKIKFNIVSKLINQKLKKAIFLIIIILMIIQLIFKLKAIKYKLKKLSNLKFLLLIYLRKSIFPPLLSQKRKKM